MAAMSLAEPLLRQSLPYPSLWNAALRRDPFVARVGRSACETSVVAAGYHCCAAPRRKYIGHITPHPCCSARPPYTSVYSYTESARRLRVFT